MCKEISEKPLQISVTATRLSCVALEVPSHFSDAGLLARRRRVEAMTSRCCESRRALCKRTTGYFHAWSINPARLLLWLPLLTLLLMPSSPLQYLPYQLHAQLLRIPSCARIRYIAFKVRRISVPATHAVIVWARLEIPLKNCESRMVSRVMNTSDVYSWISGGIYHLDRICLSDRFGKVISELLSVK